MGILDRLFGVFRRKLKMRFLIVGLDNSGKSTLVNALRPKKESIAPTVGFNCEKFDFHGVQFQAFDMSGQGKYRDLWDHHFKDCDVRCH